MAMLAEPRQRKRYNLTPRGKALYEDDTRFGTKMLEKMGWSKGKGLGANEDGSQDFVHVRMRNTNEGLGYEDRDDHWTQHEQDFNGLLKSLNGDDGDDGDDGDNETADEDKESASDDDAPKRGFGFASKKLKVEKLKDKISGVSLEQKSKQSRARVHYQKFTKGKDIAQYSEKDLANIFGKKVVETDQADGVKEDNEKSENAVSKQKELKPNFAGVQTISTGLSVSDYFKQKMESLKNKQKQNNNENANEVANVEVTKVQEEEPTQNKKKSKKRKHEREADETVSPSTKTNVCTKVADDTVLEVQEKKEKQKKTKNTENIDIENEKPSNESHCEAIDNLPISKTHKTKEADNTIATMDLTDEVDIENDEVPKKKKKKKSKENAKELHRNQNEVIDENKAEEIGATEVPKKKKKSKKSKREQSQEEDDVIIVNVEAPAYEKLLMVAEQSESLAVLGPAKDIKVKKNKKSKHEKRSAKALQASETEVSVDETIKPKKSKKDVSEDKQPLTLDELIAKCNSFNIYTISSFVAEKFRNVDLDSFNGSTITHLPGYTQTEDCQLKVVNEPKDEERIIRLWNCSENKYTELNPKAIYGRYKRNIMNAYINKGKAKKPLPLFNIKSLKRKSVFQPI